MPKYRYTGEDKFFIKKGTIVEGDLVTWSVKRPNSSERDEVKLLYIEGAGFRGETMPISSRNLVEVI
jgi:hypothetical protein